MTSSISRLSTATLPFNALCRAELTRAPGNYGLSTVSLNGPALAAACATHSAAAAYLRPALRRPNLTLITRAHISRLLMRGSQVTGVEYVCRGTKRQAFVGREVIVSAGAYQTPQILMLSGLGPAEHLAALGITPVADLPVGKNLQDHYAA